jgi:replicative DNA helicase
MLTGKMSEEDMKHLYKEGIQKLSRLNIFFDEKPGLTIQKLRGKARRLKKKNNLGLIVIDYMQLMTPSDNKQIREQQVSEISKKLKELAQELDVPVIALSQLSREVEKRTSGIPQLSDLRESGSIEQDADIVMLLYGATEMEIETAKAEGNLQQVENTTHIKIAKQRDGMLITADLLFTKEFQLFEEINKVNELGASWKPVTQTGVVNNYYEPEKKDNEMPF